MSASLIASFDCLPHQVRLRARNPLNASPLIASLIRYAFGLEILDDTDTKNETLKVYDTSRNLLGQIRLDDYSRG